MRKHYPLDPTTGLENAALLPWTDGVPATGTDGSYPGQALVVDQETEILNAIAAAGLTTSGSDLTQLTQAMATGIFVGVFTGTANALTAVLPGSVAIPTLRDGLTIHGYLGGSANTGAATLHLTGFGTDPGTKSIVLRDGVTALAAGDLAASGLLSLRYDAGNSVFRVIGVTVSEISALVKSISNAPPSGLISYGAGDSGTWVCPAGVNYVFVRAWGGGGGGGAAGTSGATASGGGGGAYSQGFVPVTPGNSYSYAVGVAGTGSNVVGIDGSGGGTTFFASGALLVQAAGGSGGKGANNASNGVQANGGSGTLGGSVLGKLTIAGGIGQDGLAGSGGGGAPMGGPPCPRSVTNAGNNNVGFTPGGGGPGGQTAFGSPQPGGTGGGGLLILQYYS